MTKWHKLVTIILPRLEQFGKLIQSPMKRPSPTQTLALFRRLNRRHQPIRFLNEWLPLLGS